MKINKYDVLWNYGATFFKVASSILLLPLILRYLSSEEVGVWAIFSSIAALVFLLDFGFNSSFTRNITYVFSGATELKKEGFSLTRTEHVNYSLLNGTLGAMRWFYSRVALFLFVLLITAGSWYIYSITGDYQGDKTQLYAAWIIFCCINAYNLYTLYYESLLTGKGLIRTSKQIVIVANMVYLMVGAAFVLSGFGLVALVMAQLISVIIVRVLSYRAFFTRELKQELRANPAVPTREVLQATYPNAVKYGVTSLGGFMIQKSSIFIGSAFIALSAIGSFGITKQIIDILIVLANIALATYLPKITQLRVEQNNAGIKAIYIKGILAANLIFILGAAALVLLGPPILSLIGSNTQMVESRVLAALVFSALIGLNAGISGAVISTRNTIPFMKPSLYSGFATIVLLFVVLKYTDLGLLGMALAPGLIDLCYQGWKWPLVVIQELKITFNDVVNTVQQVLGRKKLV
jgi:O-antigen/teichoic acid export membrane protein